MWCDDDVACLWRSAINAVRFDALPKRLRVVGIRALCPTAPFRNAAVRTFLRNLPPSCAHLATRGHRYTATSLHPPSRRVEPACSPSPSSFQTPHLAAPDCLSPCTPFKKTNPHPNTQTPQANLELSLNTVESELQQERSTKVDDSRRKDQVRSLLKALPGLC